MTPHLDHCSFFAFAIRLTKLTTRFNPSLLSTLLMQLLLTLTSGRRRWTSDWVSGILV